MKMTQYDKYLVLCIKFNKYSRFSTFMVIRLLILLNDSSYLISSHMDVAVPNKRLL